MKASVRATLTAFFFSVLMAGTTLAGSPGHTTLVLDLDSCISTALQAAPEIGEA